MKPFSLKTLLFLCALTFFFAAPHRAAAEEVLVEAFGYYLDIPEGWKLVDAGPPALVSFAAPGGEAVFQVTVFPQDKFASASALAAFYRGQIAASGKEAPFTYQGSEALVAHYTFRPGAFTAQGWFFFITGASHSFALAAFCETSRFEALQDVLLSCIDSFAPSEADKLSPGPVSQFYEPFPGKPDGEAKLSFMGNAFSLPTAQGEIDANSTVIEREARILAAEKALPVEAWKRFYRIIYRDSYSRLLPLKKALTPILAKTPKEEIPARLLSWFQGFAYKRTGTLSDFQSPLECVLTSSGDCDSLGAAYIILLHEFGFDAILLVSSQYSHSLAAVDMAGSGARFEFEGKKYLVAELTKKVAPGLIDRNMADPALWLPVGLGRPVEP